MLRQMLFDRVLTIARSKFGSMASSSTEMSPKPLARLSVCLVGRVGRSQSAICPSVTATRSKMMSASGASSSSVSSIFSAALTPDGSKSPK